MKGDEVSSTGIDSEVDVGFGDAKVRKMEDLVLVCCVTKLTVPDGEPETDKVE